MKNNLLCIVGPTATGKTRLAEEIKYKIEHENNRTIEQQDKKTELISVDSRQVYIGMDIGTGKDTKIFGTDLVKPDKLYNVSDFAKIVKPHIEKLWSHNILPILVGGTGLYLKAVIDGIETINIPPNVRLRKKLEKMTVEELQKVLEGGKLEMNNSDWNNPRRLIRKIEISEYYSNVGAGLRPARGSQPSAGSGGSSDPPLRINKIVIIGITASLPILVKNIEKRVKDRQNKGLLAEIRELVKEYEWNEVLRNTIAYKEWENYMTGKTTKEETIRQWTKDEIDYAKRQMTWFKKDKRIRWMESEDKNLLQGSLDLINLNLQ